MKIKVYKFPTAFDLYKSVGFLFADKFHLGAQFFNYTAQITIFPDKLSEQAMSSV